MFFAKAFKIYSGVIGLRCRSDFLSRETQSRKINGMNWITVKILVFLMFDASVWSFSLRGRNNFRGRLRSGIPVLYRKKPSPYVVGGKVATPHSIPYQVGLYIDQSFCGASLISEWWVLTAAHCTTATYNPILAVLGAHYIKKMEYSQQAIYGDYSLVHDDWDPQWTLNDISLLHLEKKAVLNDYVALASLPPAGASDYDGSQLMVSGWGMTSDWTGGTSSVLRYVIVPGVSNSVCEAQFQIILDSMVCVSSVGGKSACFGDSGGPLIELETGHQVGLVSFGESVCEEGYPDVYTRISSYVNWIDSNIH